VSSIGTERACPCSRVQSTDNRRMVGGRVLRTARTPRCTWTTQRGTLFSPPHPARYTPGTGMSAVEFIFVKSAEQTFVPNTIEPRPPLLPRLLPRLDCFSWALLLTVKQDTVKTSNRILDTLFSSLFEETVF